MRFVGTLAVTALVGGCGGTCDHDQANKISAQIEASWQQDLAAGKVGPVPGSAPCRIADADKATLGADRVAYYANLCRQYADATSGC